MYNAGVEVANEEVVGLAPGRPVIKSTLSLELEVFF
jgi:hypothetical protein